MVKYIDKVEEAKDRLEKTILDCARGTEDLFAYNMFMLSLVNRAMSINRGFLTLTDSDNYLCAIPLLRMQTDNCLRFYALSIVEERDSFIKSWLDGGKISDYRVKDSNQKMTDRYLVQQLEYKYQNVTGIYDSSCSYVHFSRENFLNTMYSVDDSNKIHGRIDGRDRIPKNVKFNINQCMVYVNNILIDLIYEYTSKIDTL